MRNVVPTPGWLSHTIVPLWPVTISRTIAKPNPVPAPRAGRVVEVLVEDGQPVEFGQPLIVLE